jgi:hypothetical protein
MKIILLFLAFFIRSEVNAQQDSLLYKKATTMFAKDFGITVGDYLNYYIYYVTGTRTFDYKGLGYKIIKKDDSFEYYYLYKDDAWHHDGFWYEINFDSLTKSTYNFVNRKHFDSLGYFTDKSAYKIDYIEPNELLFIDSMVIKTGKLDFSVYKFKTEHSITNSINVCMLHFISPEFGLIARQSNTWYGTLEPVNSNSDDENIDLFENRNHFSILNLTDRYELKKKGGETIKVEKKDWIIRSLRIGNPINQTVLDFYNDTISCNCNFSEVIRGHLEEFNKKPDEGNLTQKQIRKIGRKEIRYFRRLQRREKRIKKEEN